MKKGTRHIIYTWMMLICFAAGQWAIYAHQHAKVPVSSSRNLNRTTVTDKCQMCDAMHHNSMLQTSQAYFAPVVVTDHFFKPCHYDFVSIALILSAGRSPPNAS
jgi:hypothetical protein